MAKVRIQNLRNAPGIYNIPGLEGAVHIAPRGQDGDVSDPIDPHPEFALGPEVESARIARHIAIVKE